jgi:16S rRNA (guanine527-N7)-methyltransferase
VPLLEKLARRTKRAGLNLPPESLAGLERYFQLLKKWNPMVSLTSLKISSDGEEALDRLLIEPALAAVHLPPGASVIDVGSGGGSPAIPMKLVAPAITMRMVESKTRKAAFLRETIRQLELGSVFVEETRVQDLVARPELREAADVVSVRAVRLEKELLSTIRALLKPTGSVFLFRSGDAANDGHLATEQLRLSQSYVLLPQLQSRLVILQNVPQQHTSLSRSAAGF